MRTVTTLSALAFRDAPLLRPPKPATAQTQTLAAIVPGQMTDKQKERIKDKIKQVKSTLTAEKRKYGAFDDSRGLRYLPTEWSIRIGDYDGGLKYLKWFNKNFPDDMGFPEFLFESTIIFFKTRQLKEAEDYAMRT